ncbi:hypothetical protein CBS63078_8973 [Aspergillus niger]|nr:hypothetical protein CBS133816_2746 [Aspergillus niger]KAI2890674.1 hypothetical protein CBS11852_6348 [Aspergillus niger]KAI2894044.1 hypothetical protein CBS63078_8973 [Aspergillus niger]KAI2948655.1 hypothetical protein CBS147323_11021 [Aspergillus niger]KAI2989608.1 hypothetical protein CBS147345_10623 [Aspergillus niger]
MDSVTIIRQHQSSIRVLQPILRAYALGYLSSTVPRVITCLRRIRGHGLSFGEQLKELSATLTSTLRLDAFPAFCAILVGGSTVFPLILFRCLAHLIQQRKLRPEPHSRPQLAGRTMDLTLFSLTRAVDLVVYMGWANWRRWRKSRGQWTLVERVAPQLTDAGVFATSAAIVMWAWFYMPERLPRSYGKWIGEVAKVDGRLIEALRRARQGVFVYGKDTGQAPLLQSMCKDYNWPVEWGDPSKTIPIPCEMVHMGSGHSCEKHALSRFTRTFKFACATYIPLQIIFRLRNSNDVGLWALRRRRMPDVRLEHTRGERTEATGDFIICGSQGCRNCSAKILRETVSTPGTYSIFNQRRHSSDMSSGKA